MTRESLAAMIHGLCDDFHRRGKEWENRTVEDYLGALAAWITDSPGSYRYLGEEMPPDGDWSFCAGPQRGRRLRVAEGPCPAVPDRPVNGGESRALTGSAHEIGP
ncbi:DUF7660 family protein [Streptomyces sp. NPDC054884]